MSQEVIIQDHDGDGDIIFDTEGTKKYGARAWITGTGTHSIPYKLRPYAAQCEFVDIPDCGPLPPDATCDIEIVNVSPQPWRPHWRVRLTWSVSSGVCLIEYQIIE